MSPSSSTSAGIALLCDTEGRIIEILGGQSTWGDRLSAGRMFSSALAQDSVEKGLRFFQHIRETHAAFGWELQVHAEDGQAAALSFNGCTLGGRVLILGGTSSENMRGFLDDLMRMQNQHVNGFRLGLKEKTLSEAGAEPLEHEPYNELTRLNNELANAQREVAKRNIELQRLMEEAHASRLLAEQANEALHESEAQFRSLVEGAPDAIFVQADDRFSYLNSTACHLFGVDSPEQLLGKPVFDRVHPSSRAFVHARIEGPRVTNEPTSTAESTWLRLDGQPIPVDASSVPISYQGLDSTLVFARDITERKAGDRRERELEIIAARAEASSKAKSAFLSTMSHEIRTPMNAILGFSQLLLADPKLAPDITAKLVMVNSNGEHLLRIINDVLDMAKIEAGRVQFAPATFNIRNLLSQLEATFSPQATAKALQLEVRISGVPVESIVADEERIRQILTNLLKNAVKYTERGRITLQVSLTRTIRGQLWLAAQVEDTGIGIAPQEQDKLFQPFGQGERSQNIQHGGTGLGLAISRGVAQLLGGDLTFCGGHSGGSIFRFEIPVSQSEDQPGAAMEGPSDNSRAHPHSGIETPGVHPPGSDREEEIGIDLIEQLREAVMNGDKARMDKMIVSIHDQGNEQSARTLQELADAYEYDRLIQLLERN